MFPPGRGEQDPWIGARFGDRLISLIPAADRIHPRKLGPQEGGAQVIHPRRDVAHVVLRLTKVPSSGAAP